jgi:DNA polymerase III epsilon subunit-like protein
MDVLFCDIETSGLDHNKCQILEIAIVPYINNQIRLSDSLHYYVDNPCITYEIDALSKFGDRIKDRKPDVLSVPIEKLEDYLWNYFYTLGYSPSHRGSALNIGGKNFGGFDKNFILKYCPGVERCFSQRFVDIGNKFEMPGDLRLPDLETCRKRALARNYPGQQIQSSVTHTALEDAFLCAELYKGWCNDRLIQEYNISGCPTVADCKV